MQNIAMLNKEFSLSSEKIIPHYSIELRQPLNGINNNVPGIFGFQTLPNLCEKASRKG